MTTALPTDRLQEVLGHWLSRLVRPAVADRVADRLKDAA